MCKAFIVGALLFASAPAAEAASRYGDAQGAYIIGVHDAGAGAGNRGVVVNVKSTRPLVVVLTAHTTAVWLLTGDIANVRGVIVNGAQSQRIGYAPGTVNLRLLCTAAACPAGSIPVELHSGSTNDLFFPPAPSASRISPNYVYQFMPAGSPEAHEFSSLIHRKTGLAVRSLKAYYATSTVYVGDQVASDPAAAAEDVQYRTHYVDSYLAMLEPLAKNTWWFGTVSKPVFAVGFVVDDTTKLPGFVASRVITELKAYRAWLHSGEKRGHFAGEFVTDLSRVCRSNPGKICDAGDPDHRGGAFLRLKNPETDSYWRHFGQLFWLWYPYWVMEHCRHVLHHSAF